ncbi:type II toxin-antitoxin system RelE/ParE family toxin [Pseudorhodoferax sp.]|uniref:type II toxin-antitoxin system RelE/ParE family toxin n=1 Tax=Pseudorhodoferax sp. TaxID=1993553 RepID=UPI002DD6983F|nr:type II toxin-antitoxin system RelE/ParE family toxin [Pseudorhodoferax sp.]
MTRSIHRLAVEDLREAAGFYRREAGAAVALRFLGEFERVARLLEEFPGIGTRSGEGRQSFPLVGFPYTVVYRHHQGELRVLVVRHQRRDPAHGMARR